MASRLAGPGLRCIYVYKQKMYTMYVIAWHIYIYICIYMYMYMYTFAYAQVDLGIQIWIPGYW